MAGFEVITYGRFWVTAEAPGKDQHAGAVGLRFCCKEYLNRRPRDLLNRTPSPGLLLVRGGRPRIRYGIVSVQRECLGLWRNGGHHVGNELWVDTIARIAWLLRMEHAKANQPYGISRPQDSLHVLHGGSLLGCGQRILRCPAAGTASLTLGKNSAPDDVSIRDMRSASASQYSACSTSRLAK